MDLLAPQPRRPLNVPAILEAFENMIHPDTSLGSDASLWLDWTSWPDWTLLPDLSLNVGQFLQQEDQTLFGQPATASPTPMQLNTPFSLDASWWEVFGDYEESNGMLDQVCYHTSHLYLYFSLLFSADGMPATNQPYTSPILRLRAF
jgi:hypothetical protein